MQSLRQGAWGGLKPPTLGHDLQGKVLGILGFGGIGKDLGSKNAAFSMRVIRHNRHQSDSAAEYVSFKDLLKERDALSLNLPLDTNTYHVISTAQLRMMKPTALIVNTAQGGVIGEEALVQALDQGFHRECKEAPRERETAKSCA